MIKNNLGRVMLLPKPIKPGRGWQDFYPRPSDAIAQGGGASDSPCWQAQEFKHPKGFPEASGTDGARGWPQCGESQAAATQGRDQGKHTSIDQAHPRGVVGWMSRWMGLFSRVVRRT